MLKLFRFVAFGTISAAFAFSTASAQEFATIQFPGAPITVVNGGPNPEGTSVGSYVDTAGVTHGFTLSKNGTLTSFDPPGSVATTPDFIDPQGTIVGGYVDAGGTNHGFILEDGEYTTVNFQGAAGTVLTGISPSGEMSGFSCEAAACNTTTHSFLVSKKGVFTSFDPPGAISSSASTVSPSGEVVGNYTDSGGKSHGYVLNKGTYTTIDVPGAAFTFAGGGNPEGDVVGESIDAAGVLHAFLLSKGVLTTFEAPGAGTASGQGSGASGINPAGTIVGFSVTSTGGVFGFVRTK
jgi:hypothetical protein